MSNFEEKKYKQTLINETPNLWDRIDSNITDIYTKDSAPNMDMTQLNNSSPRVNKPKTIKIYKIAGIIAASIAVIAIPLAIKQVTNTNKYELTKDAMPDQEIFDTTINSITSNVTSDSVSENSNTIDKDAISDTEAETDSITNSNDCKGETTMDTTNTITCTITKQDYSDSLGLIYIVKVTDTNIDNISKDSIIYISLRNLSKTELGIKHEIGSSLTIKLGDTSYLSTLDKPYFVTAIIK